MARYTGEPDFYNNNMFGVASTGAANDFNTQVAENIVNYRQSISPYGKENGVDGYLLENLSAEFLEQKYKIIFTNIYD